MGKNLNFVMIEGNLTRDPEFGEASNGSSMARFTVANDRSYKHNGEWEKETNFMNVVGWSYTAEKIRKQDLRRGFRVRVQGRIDQTTLTSKEGNRINSISIIASNVDLLDKPRSAAEQSAGDQAAA